MLCAMIFVIAATVYNELDSVLIIGIIVMTLFMGIPSFIVLLLYTKCRVSFNETSFQVTNLYGKTKFAKWNDVVGMKLNSFTNFYTLTLYNGDKIKISQHLVGLKIFLDFLNRGSNK